MLPAYVSQPCHSHVGCTTHQMGQGATMTCANLHTVAAHVGTSPCLHLPPAEALKGNETTLQGPGSISTSQSQKVLAKTQSSASMPDHPSSRLNIYHISSHI